MSTEQMEVFVRQSFPYRSNMNDMSVHDEGTQEEMSSLKGDVPESMPLILRVECKRQIVRMPMHSFDIGFRDKKMIGIPAY